MKKIYGLEFIIAEAGILSSSILIMLGLQDLWYAYKGKIDYDKGLIELGIGLGTGAIASYIFYRNIKRQKKIQK